MSREHDFVKKAINRGVMAVATSQKGEGSLVWKRTVTDIKSSPTIGENELHRDRMLKTPSGHKVV